MDRALARCRSQDRPCALPTGLDRAGASGAFRPWRKYATGFVSAPADQINAPLLAHYPVPGICRGSDALGPPIQNRKRESGPDRACVHMDASCGAERAHFWRQRQSARAQSSVRRPRLAASSGGSMDTTTLLIIIIVVLILFGGGWYGRGRWF